MEINENKTYNSNLLMNDFSHINLNKMVPITKVLFQTNKTMPDKYILEYINKMLTPEWKYEFYNDTDVINFFINNPISDMPYII